MIEFNDSIRAIVYCHFSTKGDFMAAVNAVDGKWRATGRLRWYREDTGDPFLDRDDKQWMRTRDMVSMEELMKMIDEAMSKIIAFGVIAGFGVEDSIPVKLIREDGETTEAFFERFKKLPFVHTKEVRTQ